MAQYWRVAGMSYLRYCNLCAEHVRRAVKDEVKALAGRRAGWEVIRGEWEAGKLVRKGE